MMKFRFSMLPPLCASFLCCSLSPAGDSLVYNASAWERSFDTASTAGDASAMLEAARNLDARLDAELNRCYRAKIARLELKIADEEDPTMKAGYRKLLESTRTAQRAWLKYREAELVFTASLLEGDPAYEARLLMRRAMLAMQCLKADYQLGLYSFAGPQDGKLLPSSVAGVQDPYLAFLKRECGNVSTEVETRALAARIVSFWDDKLASYVHALSVEVTSGYEPSEKVSVALKEAQKAWLTYRDAALDTLCPDKCFYGTALGLSWSSAKEWLTRQRCADILAYLNVSPPERSEGFMPPAAAE